jgi:transcriptional regulator with XRE-family HTH domain
MNGLIASKTNQKNGRYIRALLVLHNINQSELARNIGISQTLVNAVITGRRRGVKRKGRVVRQAVADALGLKIEELWPDAKKAA